MHLYLFAWYYNSIGFKCLTVSVCFNLSKIVIVIVMLHFFSLFCPIKCPAFICCWMKILQFLHCRDDLTQRPCEVILSISFISRDRSAGPASQVPSTGRALAGCGDDLWAKQTGGTGRAAKTMWSRDPVSAGGSQRCVSVHFSIIPPVLTQDARALI